MSRPGSVRRAAIVEPIRTAIGSFGGSLRGVPAEDLAAQAIKHLMSRTGLDPERVDDVVLAQSYANSEAPCIGRWAALNAGLPLSIPGYQVDRRCGGGLQAIIDAAMQVQTGVADVVIAGGVESMSSIEHYTTSVRWGAQSGNQVLYDRLERGRERAQPEWRFGSISGMVETAENLGRIYEVSRDRADRFALRSHARAAAAWERGAFQEEVVPITVTDRRGGTSVFDHDEGYRPKGDLETMGRLRTVMPDGIVTAGNSSQQNDAAAVCLVVGEDQLDALGLEPIAWLESWAVAGCDPATMGIGPVPAVQRLQQRTGISFDDLDLIEINEAFAVQVLSVLTEWGLDEHALEDRLNVNGSGISLGHPIGATGARIMTTMLHELRRRGGALGLETMCIGGGQGIAAVFRNAER